MLFNFTTAKGVLSENGTTNDAKVNYYGNMADTAIISYLINVNGLPNPPVVTVDVLTQKELDQIKDFATQFTVGYFYKFESGDEQTITEAKTNWEKWFNSKFKRPRFKARGGELA